MPCRGFRSSLRAGHTKLFTYACNVVKMVPIISSDSADLPFEGCVQPLQVIFYCVVRCWRGGSTPVNGITVSGVVPTTLAVLGVPSSCPRVMSMQSWKSSIPRPLSTRLRSVIVILFCIEQKEKRLTKVPQRIKTRRQVKNAHSTCSQITRIQEY